VTVLTVLEIFSHLRPKTLISQTPFSAVLSTAITGKKSSLQASCDSEMCASPQAPFTSSVYSHKICNAKYYIRHKLI
jgi:hypothetical protein